MTSTKLQITARSILFLLPPSIKPPFQVRLGLQTNVPEVQAKGDFTITDCQSIEDAVEKAIAVVENLGVEFATDFTLVYPMFVGQNSEEEALIIDRSWKIKEAADEKGWTFSKVVPTPIF